MKRTIVALACCALFAPLAFAQTKRQTTTTTETITVTGRIVTKTAVKPGTRVRVYYTNVGHQRVIDHVVVLD